MLALCIGKEASYSTEVAICLKLPFLFCATVGWIFPQFLIFHYNGRLSSLINVTHEVNYHKTQHTQNLLHNGVLKKRVHKLYIYSCAICDYQNFVILLQFYQIIAHFIGNYLIVKLTAKHLMPFLLCTLWELKSYYIRYLSKS